MRTDVQLGKTLQHRTPSITEFPETPCSARRFPSIREYSPNGVTVPAKMHGTQAFRELRMTPREPFELFRRSNRRGQSNNDV